jgi:ribonuclease E
MNDALGQLKPPVPHDALRLRMVALHGREDSLLGMPRFLRLLRQANDAEIADVREVSDGEYEVTPHRSEGAPVARPQAPVVREAPAEVAQLEAPAPDADADGRYGPRFGVRFRRGSRGGVRMAEVPLIGVVHVDAPEPVDDAVEVVAPPAAEAPPAPRTRARAGRKRASKPKASAAPDAETTVEPAAEPAGAEGETAEPAAAPRRRARPRARRKAE